jgi:hypothetical protein
MLAHFRNNKLHLNSDMAAKARGFLRRLVWRLADTGLNLYNAPICIINCMLGGQKWFNFIKSMAGALYSTKYLLIQIHSGWSDICRNWICRGIQEFLCYFQARPASRRKAQQHSLYSHCTTVCETGSFANTSRSSLGHPVSLPMNTAGQSSRGVNPVQ